MMALLQSFATKPCMSGVNQVIISSRQRVPLLSDITFVSNLCVHHGYEQSNCMVEEHLRTFLMSPTLLYGYIYILTSHHPSIHTFSIIIYHTLRVAAVLEPILAILVW